jgi:hypothetical protein
VTPPALTPAEVSAALRAAGGAIEAELTGLPQTLLAWHPAPGEWCVLETLGHVIEAESRGFAGRIRAILDRPGGEFQGWDQAGVAKARRDCHREPAAVLVEFRRLRAASVGLVAGLSASDLPKGGRHPSVGHLEISDLLAEWVHHDRNHMRQMLANVQAYVWPHMGNAQKFSSA